MIFGDPNNFAVWVDYIPQWSADGGYRNGVFHFLMNRVIFPQNSSVATLSGDLYCLLNGALIKPVCDESLFLMPASEAFVFMLRSMLPELVGTDELIADDFVSTDLYEASTYNLEEGGCYVFAVEHDGLVRVLGADVRMVEKLGFKWEDGVVEVFVEKEQLRYIISSVENYVSSLH
ncbi:immunity 42 family protein [Chromobacterium piscinae]|uniref:immunity 42 family protein n=1 Tax=Chromobacterium piscinae TaxID=686831 RepID=UPI003207C577